MSAEDVPEDVPDGTFGGPAPQPRPCREQQRRAPDPEAAQHFAELAAAVAELDRNNGYGVRLKYRQRTTPNERKAA